MTNRFKAVFFAWLVVFSAGCASRSVQHKAPEPTSTILRLQEAPDLSIGSKIKLGGFSGLIYEETDPVSGEMRFLTHTDRGPNAPSHKGEVVLLAPNYSPEWIRLSANPVTGQFRVIERIGLRLPNGKPMSGRPNRPGDAFKAGFDEIPVTSAGKKMTPDPMGIDPEGIAKDRDGTYWMVEEYRPSILHFDSTGRLLERFVPNVKNARRYGTPALPSIYDNRRMNRGFEGVAIWGDKLFAFMQSPLDNPDDPGDRSAKRSIAVRILEFDTRQKKVTGEYFHLFDSAEKDLKIGDAIAVGANEFLVIEQTGGVGAASDKKLYRLDIRGATNILGMSRADRLESDAVGLIPARKERLLDLSALGYRHASKAEGLALVNERTLAIINDNDFAAPGAGSGDESTLTLVTLPTPLYGP
jgi:3-phytase